MSEANKPFTCKEIESIAELIDSANRRERTVRDLIAELKSANSTLRAAQVRFEKTLAEKEGLAVEQALAAREKIDARITALCEVLECERAELPRVVREAVIQSEEMRRLIIHAYETKARETEKLIEPAREGLVPRIAKFFSGSRLSVQEASEKASRVTAQGRYLSAVSSRAEVLRHCAISMRNERIDLVEAKLESLKKPLPSISDFADIRH